MKKINKKTIQMTALAAVIGLSLSAGAVYAADEPAELNGDTVEYSMKTGEMTANGNVVMKQGGAVMTGAHAVYNTKTQQGQVTGGVVADRDDMHMTCAKFTADGQNHLIAVGDVHAVKADKTFTGPQAEYFTDQDYVRMEQGGTITNTDGSFTADHMEGWLKEDHFKGVGNAHVISPPKAFEGGGDQAEYFGQENGKAVFTGNAWAIQDNNTMKSQRLTVYLDEAGQVKTE